MNGNRKDLALWLLRIGFGGLMLVHGLPKLASVFRGEWAFANPIGIGEEASLFLTVFAEFVCSIFVILGLFTRWACIPLIITMLVAVFIIHGGDPLSDKELALIYLIGFTAIFISGPGKYSLDARIKTSSTV